MANTAYGTATANVVDVTPNDDDEITLNLNHGNHFRWADATGTITVDVANIPGASTSAPSYVEWYLLVEATSTGPTITWDLVDTWVGGTAGAVGNDEVVRFKFYSYDGGTTVRGVHEETFSAAGHSHG